MCTELHNFTASANSFVLLWLALSVILVASIVSTMQNLYDSMDKAGNAEGNFGGHT